MEDLYYDIDCPTLDLGEREGWTQYIDFITWDEVIAPVMKDRLYWKKIYSYQICSKSN